MILPARKSDFYTAGNRAAVTGRSYAWLHTRYAWPNLQTLVKAGLTRSAGAWVLA